MWNKVDFTDIMLTLFLAVVIMPGDTLIPIELARVIAAFSSCVKIVKLFDWLRLFEATSFYIHLIQETLDDIQAFMILYVMALLMFAVPLILMNLKRADEESQLLDDPIGFWLFNALVNQYLLSLGEFSMDAFNDNANS